MITKKQIKEGLDKAYKEAGDNAYFGNGFELGVEFALKQLELTAVVQAKPEKVLCNCKTKKPDNWFGTYCTHCGFDLP